MIAFRRRFQLGAVLPAGPDEDDDHDDDDEEADDDGDHGADDDADGRLPGRTARGRIPADDGGVGDDVGDAVVVLIVVIVVVLPMSPFFEIHTNMVR